MTTLFAARRQKRGYAPGSAVLPAALALLLLLVGATAAAADTLSWGSRPATDLLSSTDTATVNGITITTSAVTSGGITLDADNVTIEPTSSSNGTTGYINSQMDARQDNQTGFQTTTINFSAPVYQVTLTVWDIDGGPNYNDSGSAFNDIVDFNSSAGLPTSGTPAANVSWNSGTGRASATSNANLTNATGNVTVTFAGPVTWITIKHIAGAVTGTNNPTNQWVFIEDVSWRKVPTVKVQKTTTGAAGGPFSFSQTNLASAPADITTSSVGTATPASPTAINVTTVGTAVTLTETVATGYTLTGASCTDANSAVTGNTGSIGSLSGSTLTIPSGNVVAGADFTCVFTNRKIPTVKVQKTTTGAAGGPFTFSQTNLASTPGNITTTAVGTATPASPTAINVTTVGTAVTLTETVATGYTLTGASCTDANSAITGNTGSIGSLSGNTLTIAASNVVAGADFTCLFTNRKIPTVKVQKTTTGAAGGPFSFSQTNLASTPAAITTSSAGTATPASPTAINVTTVGTAVTLTETVATGYTLTGASCTDANSAVTGNTGSIGSLSGSTLTIAASNVVAGADFTCVFTNRKIPTVKVQKTTTGTAGGPFSFSQTNLASTPSAITTSAVGTATPASPTAINVTTVGTAVTLTETVASGYQLTAASCTDANSAVTGNTGSIGSLSGNTLTIASSNVVAGADFTCVFTNGKIPTVKVQKTTTGAAGGPFSFSQTNLASTPGNITTTAVGTATPASPTAINVTTIGTAVTLTETVASGYQLTAASCTDANSAVTGNTGSIGSLSGSTLTIAASNVVGGADFTCVFTNRKIPTVKVQKTTTGAAGGPFSFSQTNLASAPADITTSSVGTATPASPTAINVTTVGTAVTLTETVATGYTLTGASCTDANSAVTGNTGSIGSLSGSTLTIPSGNVVAGADFTCVFTNRKIPTVKVQKTTTGAAGGPFSFSQTNLASAPADITTSSVGTATPASPTAINVTTVGTAVTLTETVATGYTLTGASCTDANSAVTGNTGSIGSLSGSTLTIPSGNVVAGADFTCVFTNRKIPTVKVQKTTTGAAGGPFSFSQTNLASTPGNITTTAVGTATPASPTAINVTTVGTAVTLTETVASGYVLTGASCTDANSAVTGNTGSIGSLSGSTLTIAASNVVAGADFTCVFTNRKIPTVKVQKTTTGAAGGPFSFSQTNLASAPADITTSSVGSATPASPTAINVTTVGTAVTLTETVASGYTLTAASCTDANSAVTGNTGSIGSLSGNTLTIASSNVVAGADFTCIFTNRKIPTVKVQKTTTGAAGGPFSFSQTNLASTPGNITTTAVGTATPASPTAINVTTVGTAVTLTETVASGYTLTGASCTDANSAVTGNTGSIGSLSGSTLTIPSGNVVAGADFTCVFTNRKIPTVKVQKTTTGAAGGPFSFSQTNLASAPADITTSSVGTATPASPTAINVTTVGTAVTLTETVASGYTLTGASCTDANSAVTGNTGSIGSLSGSTLTIPSGNVVAGADFTCVFTNRKIPTVKVQKITTAGAGGPFTFSVTNLAAAPSGITTVSAGTATPASPTAINVTTVGTAVTLTETVASGYVLTAASCTDANSAVTGNTGSIGSLSGSTLTIAASNVVAGADFTCVFTNLFAIPQLSVSKSANVASVDAAGDVISYTIAVSNTGNVAVSSITVSDPMGSVTCATSGNATIATLAVSATENCTFSYTVTQADLDLNGGGDGDIDNTATASGSFGATSVSANGSASVTLVRTPHLSLAKVADTAGPVNLGDVITYTFTVTNDGNLTISGVTVSDSHNGYGTAPVPGGEAIATDAAPSNDSTDAAADGSWDTLAPGDSITFTATYTVIQDDVDYLQ